MRKFYPVVIMLICLLSGCAGNNDMELTDIAAEETDIAAETTDIAIETTGICESTARVQDYGGIMKQKEWMQEYLEKLNLVGISTDRNQQKEIISSICRMPKDMLGEEYSFEAKVYYDWFDSAVINYLNEIIEEHNRDKFLYNTSDGGGGCILFYDTEKWAEQYNKLFPELRIGKEVG